MSDTTVAAPVSAPARRRRRRVAGSATRGASRVFLAAFTWAYMAWSILPVIIAIVFSFNAGRSRSTWQGFSLRWWWQDPNDSLFHDPALRSAIVQSLKLSILTVLVAVPLGDPVRDRPRPVARTPGRRARTSRMLFSFVLPEIIIGVALYLVVTYLLKEFVNLGTTAQLLGVDHVPDLVSGDHRSRPITVDRPVSTRKPGWTSGRRRAGDPRVLLPAALSRDLRERRHRVRGHDR